MVIQSSGFHLSLPCILFTGLDILLKCVYGLKCVKMNILLDVGIIQILSSVTC